jgi:hypothetical protein
MKVHCFIENTNDLPPEALRELRSKPSVDFHGLRLGLGIFGYSFTYYGYPADLPTVLKGRKIAKVVLEDDNTENFPAEGTYRRGATLAVVDTGFGAPASGSPRMWYVTVTGKTLKSVLRFYDDIRTGAVQPKVNWGEKSADGQPAVNLEEVRAHFLTMIKVLGNDRITPRAHEVIVELSHLLDVQLP